MGFQFNTDFTTIKPSDGGSRAYLPVSPANGWLVQIVETDGRETAKKDGTMLFLRLQGMEGEANGKFHDHFINIRNPNAEAVRIGLEEASAIAHVVGHTRVGNADEWKGKPFRVVVALAKDQEKYPGSTDIVAIRDANGRKPSEAGQGALSPTGGQPSGFQQGGAVAGQQGQPAGGFGGGQQQQQAGGFQQGGFTPNQGQQQTGQPAGGGFQQQGQGQGGFQQGGGTFQQGGGGQPNW